MEPALQWVAFVTILRKEVRRITRIWVQTLIPPAITMALYFVIFGNLIGSRIGSMGGFSYMEFVVPGLIMMAVINNSYANVASSFYGSKFTRSVEEILVSPTPSHILLLGWISGGVFRGLSVGFLVTLLSLFFADLRVHNLPITLGIILLTSVLFSLGGMINGILANSFDHISIVPTFILTPMTYLGGVFYSVSLLPEFWQNVSLLNPVLYMVNVFRYGILGVSDVSVMGSLAGILVFLILAFSFCMFLLEKSKRLRM